MSNRISTKELDINELEKKKELEKKPMAIDIADNCFVVSEVQGEEFCNGFNEGIRIMKELSGLDPKDFNFECTLNPFIDYDNPDNKRLEAIGDPNLREILLEQYIDIAQNIETTDPFTQQKIASKDLVKRMVAKRDTGVKEGVYCSVPPKLLSDKFCKGFEQGVDIFLGRSKLSKDKFVRQCKSEENPKDKKKRKIIYGIRRND